MNATCTHAPASESTPVANGRRDPHPHPYNVVWPSVCQLQARWERRDPACPPPSTALAGGDAATRQDEGGQALSDFVREPAPAHDGDEGNKVEVPVKLGDTGATSACMASNDSAGADGGGGGDGSCGEGATSGGEGGAGKVGASATKSEEYLLQSAGSMVEGLGGGLEGDEVRRTAFGLYCVVVVVALLWCGVDRWCPAIVWQKSVTSGATECLEESQHDCCVRFRFRAGCSSTSRKVPRGTYHDSSTLLGVRRPCVPRIRNRNHYNSRTTSTNHPNE